MSVPTISLPSKNLMKSVLKFSENVHYQTCPGDLVLDTLRLGEGSLNDTGALVIQTGEFTGRSPKDKFTVKDEVTENTVHWNDFNIPIDEKYYNIIYKKMIRAFRPASIDVVPVTLKEIFLESVRTED